MISCLDLHLKLCTISIVFVIVFVHGIKYFIKPENIHHIIAIKYKNIERQTYLI